MVLEFINKRLKKDTRLKAQAAIKNQDAKDLFYE
jgi:hypothetical protein